MATCDAGHGCTITCEKGCGAIWTQPDGPCQTWCEESATLDIGSEDKFSVEISEMTANKLIKILRGQIDEEIQIALEDCRTPISISEQNIGLKELGEALKKCIQP